MKARLKTLPDKLRSAAWPSSARAVKCHVKSCNERDPCPYLPTFPPGKVHYKGTARVKWEEGAGNGRYASSKMCNRSQYGLNAPGYTRHTMAGIMGRYSERRR